MTYRSGQNYSNCPWLGMCDCCNLGVTMSPQTSCQLIQVVFFHTGDVEGLLKHLVGLRSFHHEVKAVEPHKPVLLNCIHVAAGVAAAGR